MNLGLAAMPGGCDRSHGCTWREWFGVAALISLFLGQSAACIFAKSFTWDETKYLGIGRHLWQARPWTLAPAVEHPPLTFYLSNLGLSSVEISESDDALSPVERGRATLRRHGERVVYLARLPMLVLGVALGITVFLWSRELFGTCGAFLSLALYALSPNLIAHQSLITPDFALTTFFFTTGWCGYRLARSDHPAWALATGLSAGLALLAKFTALFLGPVGAVWVAVAFFSRRVWPKPRWGWSLAIVLLSAALVVLAGYQFQLRPLLEGVNLQFQISREPWPSFLLGEVSETARPHYFLIAFLLKVPVPVLVLLLLLCMPGLCRGCEPAQRQARWFLLVPVAFFFVYLSCFNRLQIGFRYLLPVLPFLYVWIGQTASYACPAACKRILITALLTWQLLSVGRAALGQPGGPHYLSYFNELAGGPENGYRWLGDSNLDWGQDLKNLKRFLDAHAQERVLVSYFGSMPLDLYGLRASDIPPPHAVPKNVLIAISVTKLQGIYEQPQDKYRWLLERPRVAQIGYSIHVYRP